MKIEREFGMILNLARVYQRIQPYISNHDGRIQLTRLGLDDSYVDDVYLELEKQGYIKDLEIAPKQYYFKLTESGRDYEPPTDDEVVNSFFNGLNTDHETRRKAIKNFIKNEEGDIVVLAFEKALNR